MKLLKQSIHPKKKSGIVILKPEIPDDLYHIANLIEHGDIVKYMAKRKHGIRLYRFNILLETRKIEYDGAYENVRISGLSRTENQHIGKGKYHTVEISSLSRKPLMIYKHHWDAVHMEFIRVATKLHGVSGDFVCILLDDYRANVWIVTTVLFKLSFSVSCAAGQGSRDVAQQKYYEKLSQQFMQKHPIEELKAVVVAGPGFARESFEKHLRSAITEINPKAFKTMSLSNVHANGITRKTIEKVAMEPSVRQHIDRDLQKRNEALTEFYDILRTQPYRCCYGPSHVDVAAAQDAIKTLMITDKFLKRGNLSERNKYIKLMQAVKANGGHCLLYPGTMSSGAQLQSITGIAAILDFEIPELADMDEDELVSDDDSKNQNSQMSEPAQEDTSDQAFIDELLNDDMDAYADSDYYSD